MQPAMKLKKSDSVEMEPIAPGGAVIADRFKLDVPAVDDGPKESAIGATIGALAALAAAAMLGAAAALMYVNWGEVQAL